MRSVIICDDVRKEQTGKELLIGVYAGAIQFPSLPAQLATFAIRIEVKASKVAYKKIKMVVTTPSGDEFVRFLGDAEFGATELPMALSFRMSPAPFLEAGEYTVSFGMDTKPEPVGNFWVRLLAGDVPQT